MAKSAARKEQEEEKKAEKKKQGKDKEKDVVVHESRERRPRSNSNREEDTRARNNSTKSEESEDGGNTQKTSLNRGDSRNTPAVEADSNSNRHRHSSIAPMMQFDDPKKYAKYAKKQMVQRTKVQKQVPLFAHLPQYERETSLSLQVGFSAEELHPSIVKLGLMYAEGTISGSNARCVAMLNAFKQFITDYQHPSEEVFHLNLYNKIKPCIRFLIDCRPQSISMGNALRWLKMCIWKLPKKRPNITAEQAKQYLIEEIDTFIQERIVFADSVIAQHGVGRITDGDVILTYAKSHVVETIIKQAYDQGKKFRVIVLDSRPKLEGRELLRRLVKHGIKCSYMLINAVSYIMGEVTKVFLGAHSMLANGTVISRAGSALVGMIAHTNNVPLLVCCETYKFHERVQIDSICFNELGDPDDLVFIDRDDTTYGNVLSDWRDLGKLKLLNLVYDLVPAEFVSMVITEVGMIPSTSVPVILREYHKDQYID